jgi:hypothetical protein
MLVLQYINEEFLMNEVFARRFHELHTSMFSIPFKQMDSFSGTTYVPEGAWQGWATSAQSLLRAVFGENSEHYENFTKAIARCG